ncbi:MAG: tyrosine-type recombinase/integrase [Anaerolineae bacterium]|nr:tyrosine-type recombinase/integrase [Anaerolineae bacterium]
MGRNHDHVTRIAEGQLLTGKPSAIREPINRKTGDSALSVPTTRERSTHMNTIQAVEEFILSKLAGGRSPKTINRYRETLTPFCTMVGGMELADVKPLDIRRFLAAYRERGCMPDTLLSHYNVLVNFWNWTQREYQLAHNPMGAVDRPKTPAWLPKRLTEDQVKALLEVAESNKNPKRNKAIVMLMLDTGIRVGELCGMSIEDIDLVALSVRVFGKDKRERLLPIGSKTGAALGGYFAGRDDGLPCAFVSYRNREARPMTVRVVQSLFKRFSKALGFHVNPHLLRSTFASFWIVNDGDEESLRRMMGHTTYAMTRRYVSLRIKDLRSKHARFSPLADGHEGA